jgi:hypothetical protein
MPLTRDKIVGFDQNSMTYRFMMMNGNRPVECSVSNAVFGYLANSRGFPGGNPDAQFLRWRETIERAISDKFDAASADAGSVKLFLNDLTRSREDKIAIQRRRRWTSEEDNRLRCCVAAGETVPTIATKFERTTRAIRRRAEILKLSWKANA